MTEAEWLTGTDRGEMLRFLRGRANDRKLRLFACACCRRIESLFTDRRVRRAVDVAELFADGRATDSERAVAEADLWRALSSRSSKYVWRAARAAVGLSGWEAASEVSRLATGPHARAAWDGLDPESVPAAVCDLLRDVVGNPFRPPTLDPAWLRWGDGTVGKLARAVYASRHFGDLPILADALEEAGCTDEDVLNHCRGPGVHVRGCWVLDLVRSGD